jgi:Uma2 family endonuclease
MVMPQTRPQQGEWTLEDWRLLPEDGDRYEVLDGVLFVTPAPRAVHQRACKHLLLALEEYLAAFPVGEILWSPAEIAFTRERVVQPDLFVAPLHAGRGPRVWEEIARLVLAIEVLSASTAARDRSEKRKIYQQHADEYWIMDPDARVMERWMPGDARPEIIDRELTWQPPGAAQPFRLDLPEFFRKVWGE